MSEATYPTVDSQVPARMDRLPFARWHVLVIIGLGVTWILDGLEVTLVAAMSSVFQQPVSGLNFSSAQIGLAGGIYIAGAVTGALIFSYLTDRFGRKKLFIITLSVYMIGTIATGFSGSFIYFVICRFVAGAGIGGEYSAIYSAVDELIPARIRGQVALYISGAYWVGVVFGSLLGFFILGPVAEWIGVFYAWRTAFFFGGILALGILLIRRFIPESPRWLATHGQNDEAERIAGDVEEEIKREKNIDQLPEVDEDETITIEQRGTIGFGLIMKAMLQMYPKRTFLGLVLLSTQALLYNAIFFTYAIILSNFYGVPSGQIPLYLLPFAAGNILGAWLLGPLFDRVGRVPMITACYGISGVLLAITGYLFAQDVLTAVTQTIAWMVIFFFATAAASAAYLTVSEVFPMEIRAMAIAVFYAIGTAVGGITGPIVFGRLIQTAQETGDLTPILIAYLIGAGAMIFAAIVEVFLGVRAERNALESVAAPLTAIEKGTGTSPAAEHS